MVRNAKAVQSSKRKLHSDIELVLQERAWTLILESRRLYSQLRQVFPSGPFVHGQSPTSARNVSRCKQYMRMLQLAMAPEAAAISILSAVSSVKHCRDMGEAIGIRFASKPEPGEERGR